MCSGSLHQGCAVPAAGRLRPAVRERSLCTSGVLPATSMATGRTRQSVTASSECASVLGKAGPWQNTAGWSWWWGLASGDQL